MPLPGLATAGVLALIGVLAGSDRYLMVAAIIAAVALGMTVVALVATLHRGKNEVYGTTAVEAATPRHRTGAPRTTSAHDTRLVTDAQLAKLATRSFAPPDDIAPWQGRALLVEVVDQRVADAFVAELIVEGALEFNLIDGRPSLRLGQKLGRQSDNYQQWARALVGADGQVFLDRLDLGYTRGVKELQEGLRTSLSHSGWWRNGRNPGLVKTNHSNANAWVWKVCAALLIPTYLLMISISVATTFGATIAVFISSVVTLVTVAFGAASGDPERTAEGSAHALQVESFRRFIAESETQHVERAWEYGQLREYSAWGIAIGDADAWRPLVAEAQSASLGDVMELSAPQVSALLQQYVFGPAPRD